MGDGARGAGAACGGGLGSPRVAGGGVKISRRVRLLMEAMAIPRPAPLASAAAPLLAPRAPNIIFILVDDLGYGDLGITGNRDVPTPHMDSIGREGVRFTQFYCASPVC